MALSRMPIMLTDFRLVISPMVTASDASPIGMAVVRSAGLTAEGNAALDQMREAQTAAAGERVGLVDLFGGIGGTRRALELIGIEPGVHVHVDSNATASAITHREWPGGFRLDSVEAIDEEEVKKWVAAGPHVNIWIVFATFPTHDVMEPTSSRKHTGGLQAALSQHINRITELVRKADFFGARNCLLN